MSQFCIYNFGHIVHHADWNFKIPGSVFWRVYLMLEGVAEVVIYDRAYTLRPGHLYLIPAFTTHEDRSESTFTHEYIHFRVEDPSLESLLNSYSFVFELPATPLTVEAFGRVRELCPGYILENCVPSNYEKKSSYQYWTSRYNALPQNVRFEIEGCVRVILAHFMNNSPLKKEGIRPEVIKLQALLDRHYCDDISISDLASQAGLRAESFIRAFRQGYNVTPHAYIMMRRINEAKNLLLLTSLSVKEIAARVGFSDPSYFGAVFRRHTSMTPNRFRREHF